jgi:ubiquinone/menaquinone biosynthesis C-methylase UbiE
MTFDPQSISKYFDQYGQREWDRLVATPADEISLHIHTHYLHRFIKTGDRVLEIGAGAGRFTQMLAEMGSRVLVADISPGQLALNQQFAEKFGFDHAVEGWKELDICNLSALQNESFDRVIVYGGPFSYVLNQ